MTERVAVPGVRATRGRVVAVIAMGALALTGLSACRNTSGAAAFVGNTRISQDQVKAIVASIPAAALKQGNVTAAEVEPSVVQTLTFNAIAAKFAKDNGYGVATPTVADEVAVAQNIGVSAAAAPSNKYAQMAAELAAWHTLLLAKMPPGAATETDYQDLFNELASMKQLQPGTTFDKVQPQLKQVAPTDLAQANALRMRLNHAVTTDNVSINPRYDGTCTATPCIGDQLALTELTIPDPSGQSQPQNIPIMFVNFGQNASPPVLDPSTPASAAPAA